MEYEDALRLWGATKLMDKYEGLTLDDINLSDMSVEICPDPGCPDAEDSYYEPASAYVNISAKVIRSTDLTWDKPSGWVKKKVTENFGPTATSGGWASNRYVEERIDYPDMFTIVREMNEVAQNNPACTVASSSGELLIRERSSL